ncbi:thiamine phosphate synthase [Candidatus Methylacidithermus pantelleriae]|uniref:Thiamine-phosphate synthase n=1 Tax=Candidatus Methylacidithermus pantelleriae TaxID=2744239 RepID=A0A8J2BHC3_9BACT|nr:thiamine phosphate synthase [Candidatus Methylacidithermus pantelleriae]CAF0689517.1 Thiamine-phosphate synthase [Candidatus Methylacidithermus pantelleriae]
MPTESAIERKWRLSQARLYVILDLAYLAPEEVLAVAQKALAGGADLLQLRAKGRSLVELFPIARELARICRDRGALCIMNDWPELAEQSGADGVHLGQEDLSIGEARKLLGPQAIIGQSTHSLEQAMGAEQQGADYIGIGPIFWTPTKPAARPVGLGVIREVAQRVRIPQFCIGGINCETLPQVLAAGGRRVAVVSAVCKSHDAEDACRQLKSLLAAVGLWA